MIPQHHLPADIERTSLSIITAELEAQGLTPPPETAAVVQPVIHTTPTLTMQKNLRFTPGLWRQVCRPAGRDPYHHRYQHGAFGHFKACPCPAGRQCPLLHGGP